MYTRCHPLVYNHTLELVFGHQSIPAIHYLWAPWFSCVQGHIRAPTSGNPYEEEGTSIKFTLRASSRQIPLAQSKKDRWETVVLLLSLPGTRPCYPRAPCMAGWGYAHVPRVEKLRYMILSRNSGLEATLPSHLVIPTYCPVSLVSKVIGRKKLELDPGNREDLLLPSKQRQRLAAHTAPWPHCLALLQLQIHLCCRVHASACSFIEFLGSFPLQAFSESEENESQQGDS